MKTVATIAAIVLLSLGVVYGIKSVRHAAQNSSAPRLVPPHPQDDFKIEGLVINAAGEVVPGANVYVESDNAGLTQIATGLSDAAGKFSITLREPGNYTVFGSKEEDGYPLTVSGFHQQVPLDQIPKLSIAERKNVTGVILQLGEKAGRLEGDISEAGTGQEIKHATILLRRTENPELIYRTSTEEGHHGKFKLAVPPLPFTVEVESEGYERWSYGGGGIRKAESIKLKQGESKNLHIALHKHVRQ